MNSAVLAARAAEGAHELAPAPRIAGFEALRALALLLGLVLHASMAYLPGAKHFWLVADPQPQALLGPVFHAIHAFRMPLFFALAGGFALLSLRRRGPWAFARDRGQRIALPLLLGWPMVMTGFVLALWLAALIQHGPDLPKPPPGPRFSVEDFPLAHLWFLYLLLIAYAALLLLLPLRTLAERAAAPIARGLCQPIGPLLIALPLALALYQTPYWLAWFGVPTPDQSLIPGRAALVSCGGFFALGLLMQARPELLQAWARQWRVHALVALAACACGLSQLGLAPSLMPQAQGLGKAGLALAHALTASSAVAALLGAAQAWRCPRWLQELAQASYWIYLVHLPLVIALQALLKPLPLPGLLKFAAVLALTLAIAWISERLMVRNGWIGWLLNGRRRQPLGLGRRAAGSISAP